MSAADFLLSPAVQGMLKITFAEPATPFTVADLAKLSKMDAGEVAQTLPHLVDSGVLAKGDATPDGPETFRANTAFAFYPELRRIALKSFGAAEPLGAMLRSKFRGTVLRAFILGEDQASGTLALLLVYGGSAPDRQALDLALKKLLKSGAIRQHVQADVIPERRFNALRPGDALHAQLAADTCVDISAPSARKAKPAPERVGLLEKARRQLVRLRG